MYLTLGLPLGLFPGTLMPTTAVTSLFSSILCMCLPVARAFILTGEGAKAGISDAPKPEASDR